jgi:electron transport complex protein RnfG
MNEVELTVEGRGAETSSVRLAGTLAIAGMLSGFLLAGAYQITKPIIEANKARALREAVLKVVPESTTVSRMALRDGMIVPIADDEETADPLIYGAYDDTGAFCGYAIANSGAGFQDQIDVLFGYDPARERVVGMHILASRETPGLGDKIFKDDDFVAIFRDLAIEPSIVVVKDGRDQPNEVDAITGATISSKAVVKIINEANTFWLPYLPAPGDEPPAPAPAEPPATEADQGGTP